jgi:putative peptide zinc metalloprotease protein
LVTTWVLVIVPVLLTMALTAILLFPKLAASAWESGSNIVSAMPEQEIVPTLASVVRLFGLALPALGAALLVYQLVRMASRKARRWSAGRPRRQAAVAVATAALAALLVWAWWPSGQYQPVRATDDGTLVRTVSGPGTAGIAARPQAQAAPAGLAPGRHLAVALIPRGGPTREHPAIFVVKEKKPTVLVSEEAPDPQAAPSLQGGGDAASPTPTVPAATFPFELPEAPGPNDSQALAVNTTDGAIVYDIAYSLVTVQNGDPVDSTNSAHALASCKACRTLAVSFQLVLVVGRSDTIKPINIAEALNVNCPQCVTVAIARQIVVTVESVPSDELLRRLGAELEKLGALDVSHSPTEVAAQVDAVAHAVQNELEASGLVRPSGTPTATPSPSATVTPEASATPDPTATPTPTPTSTPTPTPSPSPTATPVPTPEPTAEPTPTP